VYFDDIRIGDQAIVAPAMAQVEDQYHGLNASEVNILLWGIKDRASGELPIGITAFSSNPSLIPVPVIDYTPGDVTGWLSYTPATDQAGSAVISVIVTGNARDTTVVEFKVTVEANSAPRIQQVESQNISNDRVTNIPLSGLDDGDPNDNQILTLSASSSDPSILPDPVIEFNPGDFNAAAFISPMLGLKPFTCALVKILAGSKPKYAPGQTAYEDNAAYENNQVTGSEIRFTRAMAAFEKEPRAKLGGVSLQWADRSCRHIHKIFENIEQIETPFILFSAENEQVVDPKSHQKFIEKAIKSGKECEAYMVNNAQHEILMEKDEPRMQVITAALDFFSKYR